MKRVWVLVVTACGGSHGPNVGASVLELHGAPSRSGAYVAPTLTHAAAATLHVDPTFTATYTGEVYAQALYVDDGGAGVNDLAIVATEENDVFAFDPSGRMVWQHNLGAPQPMPNVAEGIGCGNV